jgi:hypothetical protein
VEDLIGRRVLDRDGRKVGRLEEMRATREGEYYVVSEFHIGPAALIERLAVRHLGLTWPGRAHGYRASWDQLDLSDPHRPRLLCDRSELKKA